MFNTIKTFGKTNIFIAGLIALLVQVGCGRSSSLKTATTGNNLGFGSGLGNGSTVSPADFGFGLNDNNNNSQTLPSGSSQVPPQYNEPNPALGGMSAWAYLQALLSSYQGASRPAQQDLRAIIQPGKYAFRFGPNNSMGQGYSAYQYNVQIPISHVSLITNVQNSNCAPSLSGVMASSIQICLDFKKPSVNEPLPIRVSVNGPNFGATQTLWVLVVGQAQDATGYKVVVASASGPASVPPVSIRQGIYQNESNSRSSFTKIATDFYVDVVRADNSPVTGVQSLAVEPATAAMVLPTGTAFRYIVRPINGGAMKLIARGTDQYGDYVAESQISVPRQLAAIWTRSDKANVESDDRLALVCNNMTNQPVSLGFTANTQFANVPFFLPPYGQNVRSQLFQRTADPGFSSNTSGGTIYTGNATLTINPEVPVGAVSCYAVVYDCDPSNNSACWDRVKGNHYLGRGQF